MSWSLISEIAKKCEAIYMLCFHFSKSINYVAFFLDRFMYGLMCIKIILVVETMDLQWKSNFAYILFAFVFKFYTKSIEYLFNNDNTDIKNPNLKIAVKQVI